jgi:hypothetical protein
MLQGASSSVEKQATVPHYERFNLATPEVHLQSLNVLGKVFEKLHAVKCLEVLPGVSSVATKVLSGEIKSSEKVRVKLVEIWLKNLVKKALESVKPVEDKKQKLIRLDIKSMIQ